MNQKSNQDLDQYSNQQNKSIIDKDVNQSKVNPSPLLDEVKLGPRVHQNKSVVKWRPSVSKAG